MNKHIVIGLSFLGVLVSNIANARDYPISVKTEIVKESTWQPKIHATGKLLAQHGIVVKSEISGRISHIYFKSGQTVKKGEPLVQIDSRVLLAQKKILENDMTLSKNEFDRKNSLYKKHALSKAALEVASTQLNANRAKIDKLNAELDQAHIEAPFSGKLGLRKVSLGDYLVPGEAIVNLQTTDPIFVDFDVPEANLKQLKIGQKVEIHTPAYPNESFKGTIEAVESLINPGTQSLTVRAKLNNTEHKLIAGTFVDVTLFLGSAKSVVMIPQTAVVYGANGDYVFKTDGKIAHKVQVKLGERTNKNVIIDSGLSPDDQIVTIGGMKLYDGAKIFTARPQIKHG